MTWVVLYAIAMVCFSIVQVAMFRTGKLSRNIGESDASVGAYILFASLFWPIFIIAALLINTSEYIGRFARK